MSVPFPRRLVVLAALVGVLGTPSSPVLAQSGATSSQEALFLVLPVGAKGVGMARAMSALQGPESVWWNPAGLGGVEADRIQVTRGEDISGEATSLTGLLSLEDRAVLGASYLLLDVGEVPLTDNQGNPVGEVNFRYHTGILSAATKGLGPVSLGMNLKFIQSRLACRGDCLDGGVTANTWAVDLGGQWSGVAGLPLTLGAAVVHAGPKLQIVNEAQADPLPTRIRLAAAYDVIRHWVDSPDLHARLAVELDDRWRDPGNPALYLGTEIAAGGNPGISLRAGYAFGAELQVDGAGVGIGVQYDRFDLGIGKSIANTDLGTGTDPVDITFAYVFR